MQVQQRTMRDLAMQAYAIHVGYAKRYQQRKSYRYMKKLIVLLLLLLSACNVNLNSIIIDKLSHIDVFEEYKYNLMLSKDIVNNNWNEFYSENIKKMN